MTPEIVWTPHSLSNLLQLAGQCQILFQHHDLPQCVSRLIFCNMESVAGSRAQLPTRWHRDDALTERPRARAAAELLQERRDVEVQRVRRGLQATQLGKATDSVFLGPLNYII